MVVSWKLGIGVFLLFDCDIFSLPTSLALNQDDILFP